MIIKRPMRNSKPIGRDIEFNNPFANSSKKHYWDQGEGNFGFLTTEQLQTLRKLKFRDIHHGELSRVKGNFSQRNLNATIIGVERNNNTPRGSLDEPKRALILGSKIEPKVVEPKQSGKRLLKRYKSDLNGHKVLPQSAFESIESHHSRLRHLMRPAGRESQLYHKLNSSRKVTFQQNDQTDENPEKEAFMELKAVQKSSLQEKHQKSLQNLSKRKSEIKLQSGIFKVTTQRQNSLSRSQKQKNQNPLMRIETEPSAQKDQNPSPEPNIKLSQLIPGSDPNQELYKSRKYLIQRDHLKKFKRDHSPTFCNSIDYPLNYYRHV